MYEHIAKYMEMKKIVQGFPNIRKRCVQLHSKIYRTLFYTEEITKLSDMIASSIYLWDKWKKREKVWVKVILGHFLWCHTDYKWLFATRLLSDNEHPGTVSFLRCCSSQTVAANEDVSLFRSIKISSYTHIYIFIHLKYGTGYGIAVIYRYKAFYFVLSLIWIHL